MKNLLFSCIESRVEENNNLYGCFKLGPFYLNQGLTVATTLRRFLFAELEGLAVVFIKIEGVKHEYSILKGVKESVLEILSNVKQIQFKTNHVVYKPQIAYLNVQGPKMVTAKDILLPQDIQCVDPSQYLVTIASDGELKIKMFICQGKRYCLQNILKSIIYKKYQKILNLKQQNYLFLDAVFLPIRKVNFTIEENLAVQKEFIIFEIWTKGNEHPKQSLFKAINEIIKTFIPFRYFYSLQKPKRFKSSLNLYLSRGSSIKHFFSHHRVLKKLNSSKFQAKLSKLEISNINLNFYTYLYLKKVNINTIGELLNKSKKELYSLNGFNNVFFKDIEYNFSLLGLKVKE